MRFTFFAFLFVIFVPVVDLAVGMPASEKKRDSSPVPTSFAAKSIYPYRWENGLDLLFSPLFGRSVTDIESPTFLGEALWSYKYESGTYVGATLLGSLQSMKLVRENVKLEFTTYGLGFYFAQDLWRYNEYRVLFSMSLGRGNLFVRREVPLGSGVMIQNDYLFAAPGLTGIFYQTRYLDIGGVIQYRHVQFPGPLTYYPSAKTGDLGQESQVVATEDDLKGVSFGVTFRSTSS